MAVNAWTKHRSFPTTECTSQCGATSLDYTYGALVFAGIGGEMRIASSTSSGD